MISRLFLAASLLLVAAARSSSAAAGGELAVYSTIPSTDPSSNDSAPPDPFTFANGTKVKIRADWECRRNEITSFIQAYEAGFLPPRPPLVSGRLSGNTLNVTAGFNITSTISFSSTIIYPAGAAPANGWPLLIGLDGGSIPVPSNVAVLSFSEDILAQQTDTTSRGEGLFYELYGANASASAMTAWTWGISRILDVLEATPAAKIDMTKIAVTGCSRDGKGALMAGAFEPRIALAIVQESGAACWRLSLYEQEEGVVVQTATEIVQENVWFSPAFDDYVDDLSVLPFDHHHLAARIAPWGLIVFDNRRGVAQPRQQLRLYVGRAYGIQSSRRQENLGFMQQGGHAHCTFPANQTSALDAFFGKFVLGQENINTDVFLTIDIWNGVQRVPSEWTNWEVPMLL